MFIGSQNEKFRGRRSKKYDNKSTKVKEKEKNESALLLSFYTV